MRMISRSFLKAALVTAACAGALTVQANAASEYVNFNFGAIAQNAAVSGSNSIDSILSSQLASQLSCSGCTVGASGSVYADQTWNGDGYVTGSSSKSLTLGTATYTAGSGSTPGQIGSTLSSSYTTFLSTISDGDSTCSGNPGCAITLTFSGLAAGTTIALSGFSYEIFADNSCTSSSSCSSLPTLEVSTGGTEKLLFDASAPPDTGNPLVAPYNAGTATPVGNSTVSPSQNPATAYQALGNWADSGGIVLSGDSVTFTDWPAAIGIGNLQLTVTPPSGVPEPSSMVLLGTLVGGALVSLRKKLRRA